MASVLVRVIADTDSAVAGLDSVGSAAAKLSGGLGDTGAALTALGNRSNAAAQAADDHKQAVINETKAQDALKAALAEFGEGSVEAQEAQLALNAAMRAAEPPSGIAQVGAQMEAMAPLMMGVVGAVDLLSLALNANAIAWIRNTASSVAGKIATVAGTVATVAASVATGVFNAVLLLNPIGLIVIAIVALIAVVILLWRNWDTVVAALKVAWEWIKSAAVATFDFIKSYFLTMWNLYKSIFNAGVDAIVAVFDKVGQIKDKIVEKIGAAIEWITGLPARMVAAGKAILTGLGDGISAGIAWVRDKIKELADLIPDTVAKVLGIKSPSTVMARIGAQAMAGLSSGLGKGLPKLESVVGAAAGVITGLSASPAVSLTASAGSGRGGAVSGSPVNITVNVAPGADPAEAGRLVVRAIEAYERRTGQRRLA